MIERLFARLLLGTFLVGSLMLMPGCRGEVESEEDTEPPPTAFTFFAPRPMPHSQTPAGDRIKPGHWTSLSTLMRSNAGDVRGQLVVDSQIQLRRRDELGFGDGFGGSIDGDAAAGGEMMTLPGMLPGTLANPLGPSGPALRSGPSQRSVVMPRGQQRRFDLRFLPPSTGGLNARQLIVRNWLVPDSSAAMNFGGGVIRCLQPQEYFLVVLSGRPDRMGRLATSDWVRAPRLEDSAAISRANYAIAIPPTGGVIPLPESSLDWTSIAVLWWDDLPADELTPAQVTSVIDWLHFGGRLVVSGSAAADAIRGSDLEPYLPIRRSGTSEFEASSARNLLMHWSVDGDDTSPAAMDKFGERSDRLTLDGVIDAASDVMSDVTADDGSAMGIGGSRDSKQTLVPASAIEGTDGLLAMRRVGRGVVVQSRFDLGSDWMDAWRSKDSFINAAVLGRPARRYVATASSTAFAGETPAEKYEQLYPDLKSPHASALINTGVRITSRDGLLKRVDAPVDPAGQRTGSFRNSAGSIAAWNDRSDVVNVCVDLLRDQSGIEIPSRDSVVRWMCLYLLTLVPINFLVFWLLGKIEWAWFSIPVIAILGALWMAKSAQLDIGFSRSIYRVALLESPAGSDRAHLTSVSAIYNSLSNSYQATFDHQASAASALPIGTRISPSPQGPLGGSDGRSDGGRSDVGTMARGGRPEGSSLENTLGRSGQMKWLESDDGKVGLAGVPIASNQVRMIHAEEMVEVGSWRWVNDRLVNQMDTTWQDAWVVRRDDDGQFRSARLGTIPPGASVSVSFDDSPVEFENDAPMGVDRLMASLASPATMAAGECRLIARTDTTPIGGGEQPERLLGSLQIDPDAVQGGQCTVVLAHLRYCPLSPVRKDESLLPANDTP